MIRSMTGYGAAEGSTPAGRLQVEVRTVNHRFFNANTRVPSALLHWEADLREWLRQSFPRGQVSCTVRLEPETGTAPAPRYTLDEARVAAYLNAFRQLAERFDVPGTPDLQLLSRFGDILTFEKNEEETTSVAADELRPVVEEAALQALRMRAEEGQRLLADLEERLRAIETALDAIAALAPARITAERDRLRTAVRELAAGVAVDEARLAQEIAILAERWDVNEELVRFRSHIELFRDFLAGDAEEPVGKRLSFVVQEMHREANTIGSKANDAAIAERVVEIKNEIEKLREQVENVE